jgi:hypothetical protein
VPLGIDVGQVVIGAVIVRFVVIFGLHGHSMQEKRHKIQCACPHTENCPTSCLWVESEDVRQVEVVSPTILVFRFQSITSCMERRKKTCQ